MKRYIMSLALTSGTLSTVPALAFPDLDRMQPMSVDFDAEAAAEYNFEGIVALSNCSGSLIRFDDSQDTDKAMILSNGHCVELINPGVVLVNQASTRSFDVLSPKAGRLGSLRAEKLLYATMTKTDLSLYQLRETYQDIRARYKTEALTLSRLEPKTGDEIEVISGYWKRGYSCQIEAIAPTLKEGSWTFEQSLRYSRPGCEVIGGTSGSPVLAANARTVVAVNNTTNESGLKCQVNNPCEVDKSGQISYQKGFGYAQETYWIYSCLSDQGVLDLTLKSCLLPRPQG